MCMGTYVPWQGAAGQQKINHVRIQQDNLPHEGLSDRDLHLVRL